MKRRISKRILAGILTFGMAASLMPATAFAAQEVDAKPGSGTLPVEYFSSTLYNWDESAANAATAEADRSSGTVYTETSVRYKDVASQDSRDYQSTNYWYRGNDGEYYQVYYKRYSRPWTTTYTLYYRSGNSYEEFGSTTNGNARITLYTRRQGDYEGKGLYFTAANKKQNSPNFSNWDESKDSDNVVKQNYYIYSGLAAKHLDESANIPFSDAVNAAPLFATDGSNGSYTKVYENVQVPFVYDEETGYYTLDSDSNAVYFDGSPQDNAKMAIADQPAAHSNTVGDYHYTTGFLPFNSLDSDNEQNARLSISDEGKQSYVVNGDVDWGFGMVTSVNFQMTDNGLDANGEPITFEFSGDDDVWVYVDDTLVLDIGGTHDAVLGTIDFSTGKVELTAPAYGEETSDGGKTGKIGDMATDPSMSNPTEGTISQTNIYEVLDAESLIDFASQGEHTLKIYYMERGRGRSNCLIKFNLPQRDTVSVTKEITQSKDKNGNTSPLTDAEQASIDNVPFGFTIYEGDRTLANKTYYLYEDGELTATPSTDGSGHFTLRNNQEARFTVDISEEGRNYHVVEDNLLESGYTEPEYTYSSNIQGAEVTEEANGFTGMTVAASGSSTAADSISFVCENFLDENLPNPGAALTDDTYVIDYGLPVKLENVMDNDVWRGETAKVSEVVEVGDYISESGKYGEAVLNEDGSIVYTLTKPLDRVVNLQYTVQVTGKGNSGTEETSETIEKTANIYIIPATSMYYEENFSNMVTYMENLGWQDVNNGAEYGEYQEQGKVGTAGDSTYGTDTVYLNNTGDSYGTAKYVSAKEYATQFSYEFTGTGTAIYSRISTDSPYIRVEITKDGENVDRQYIDMRMIGDVAANTTLYNIPVYNNSGLDYGTYDVTVTVYKAGTPVNGMVDKNGDLIEGTDKSGSEFYLDGIRVYQPLVNDARAEGAYASDGESNIAIINIRSKIAADAEIGFGGDSFVTLTDVNNNIVNPDDYTSIGPNEELYLNAGDYTASFYLLNWDSQRYNLYLGMKTPGSETASVQVGERMLTLNNSADCYYNVSDYVTVEMVDLDYDEIPETALGMLTVSNASGLVSLTNIKVTGMDEFDIGYSQDLEEGDIDAQTLYLLPSNYSFTDDAGEETPDEPTVFEPERFEVHVNYAKLTKKATVNAATSKDVAYITINGERVDPGVAGDTYSFALSFKKVAKGTTYEVIAYNADGAASESIIAVAE